MMTPTKLSPTADPVVDSSSAPSDRSQVPVQQAYNVQLSSTSLLFRELLDARPTPSSEHHPDIPMLPDSRTPSNISLKRTAQPSQTLSERWQSNPLYQNIAAGSSRMWSLSPEHSDATPILPLSRTPSDVMPPEGPRNTSARHVAISGMPTAEEIEKTQIYANPSWPPIPADVDAQLTALSQTYKAELARKPDELEIRKFLEARDQGDLQTARKHYLQAHGINQVDETKMIEAFHEGGKTISWRPLPGAAISLLPGLLTLLPIHNTDYEAKTKRALGYFAATLAASLVAPLSSAVIFQYVVPYSDTEFRKAANIQPELKTPQLADVSKLLDGALKNAEAAEKQMMEAMEPGKSLPPAEMEKVKKAVDDATDELSSAIHQYVLRANLNDVYFKGGQRQGIINALKFLCNLSGGWGSFFAKDARIGFAIQALGATFHMMLQRLWAGPRDEIDKQNQMIQLKMLSTKIDLGDIDDPNRDPAKLAEALEGFSKQIRTPMGIRAGILDQVISYDIRKLEGNIADMLSMEPKAWRKLQTLEDRVAEAAAGAGTSANGLSEDETRELEELRGAVEQAKGKLSPKRQAKLAAYEDEWKTIRNDPKHVVSGDFNAVSDLNKYRTYLGLQITDKKDVNALSRTPESHIAWSQAGKARTGMPEDFIPVVGQMFWSAFQLIVCGSNVPLLLNQGIGLKDAFMKQHDHKYHPEARDRLVMLSFTCMVAFMGMMAAGRLINNRLRPIDAKLGANIAATTQGSSAAGAYNVLKLYKRAFLREAGQFQKVGTSAVNWNYMKTLGNTIMNGLFVMATEGWAGGTASKKYEEGTAVLQNLKKQKVRIEELVEPSEPAAPAPASEAAIDVHDSGPDATHAHQPQ